MKHRNFKTLALTATLSTLLGIGAAYAATQTVTSDIKYFSDITFVVNATPNFGYGKAGAAGTYILDTSGALSGTGVSEGGTPAAGDYTIKGSGTQAINITAGNFVPDGDSTPSAPVCKYGSGSEVSCVGMTGLTAPGSSGTHLKVGLTVTAAGASTDGEHDQPKFDLTVVYQ